MLNPPNLSGTSGSPESLCPRLEAPRYKGQGTCLPYNCSSGTFQSSYPTCSLSKDCELTP